MLAAPATALAALTVGRRPSAGAGLDSYVDDHRRVPYSVFLGPGAAQANLPQVYWATLAQPAPRTLAPADPGWPAPAPCERHGSRER